MANARYPQDWNKIAFGVKQAASWKCSKCGMQCIQPGSDVSGLTRSERMRRTLTVHHANYQSEDNRPENLICLCSGCHLSLHTGSRGNVSIGQLKLF